MAKTTQEQDRVWNQTFQILCAHQPDTIITITLKRKRSVLGKMDIQANKLLHDQSLINGYFPLCKANGKPNKKLKLQFIVQFKQAESAKFWDTVLCKGIKNAAFPLRSNCSVKLYQDAHHRPIFQPPFNLCEKPRNLWEDIYIAINGAKHLIYIAGWSLNPKMALVRAKTLFKPHT